MSILPPPKNQSPSGRELVVREGVALRFEDREKEEDWGEEAKGSWEESCLARFSKFLGFSTVRYEELILDFMNKINTSRQKIKGKGGARTTKFDRELKKLAWNVKDKERIKSGAPGKGARASYYGCK